MLTLALQLRRQSLVEEARQGVDTRKTGEKHQSGPDRQENNRSGVCAVSVSDVQLPDEGALESAPVSAPGLKAFIALRISFSTLIQFPLVSG